MVKEVKRIRRTKGSGKVGFSLLGIGIGGSIASLPGAVVGGTVGLAVGVGAEVKLASKSPLERKQDIKIKAQRAQRKKRQDSFRKGLGL